MNMLNHLKSAFVRAAMLLAVIIMTATTARAEEITIALAEGHGSATFSEESLVFSNCEALEVGFSFDIPLEVMTQSKAYGGVVMQNYTATLDNGVTVDGTLTGEIVAAASQTYTYTVTNNEMTRRPVDASTALTRSGDSPSVEIATWSGFRKGAASFTFDDGAPSHVSDAGPTFKKYGYKATFNLVVNWSPNWSGFQGLADEGHEIASHSISHGNNMSGEEASSKNTINSKINQKYGIITVAYPNCNVPNESAVLQNYIVGRICNGSWKGLSDNMGKDGPSNWAQVPAIMTGAEGSIKSTNDFTSQMQKVVQSNGWVAFLTHGFQGKSNGSATYSPTDLKAIDGALKWAQQNDKDIWVAPMGFVAMYIKERNASKAEVQQSDETSMTITLKHTIKDNVSDYDYPLSLRVKSGWTNVAVTQAGAKLESKVDGGYIYFDAIPNGGDIVVTKTVTFCGNTAVNDGKNVVWEYDATTTTLTIRKNPNTSVISGEDFTMMDFGSGTEAPWALYSSSITTVYVEDGVQGIGNSAFDGCSNLKTVYVLRDNTDGITTLGTDAFKNCHNDLTIYVFATALSDYKNAENWSTYASKLKGLGSKIPYLDWDDTEKKLVKKTTPADVMVYVLDGTETTLGTAGTSSAPTEAWYIAKGNLSYNHYLKNANCCNIHLILEDGCDMSVDTEESPIAGDKAIYVYQAALTIYGQSTGDNMGKLTAVSNGSSGILVIRTFGNTPNLTINGGQITAKGRSAINTYIEHEGSIGGITINGGKVIATGTIGGIYASNNAGSGYKAILTINGGEVYGTNSDSDKASITSDNDIIITGGHVEAKNNDKNGNAISGKKVTITGGQVEAIGGSNGCGIHTWNDDITLGWTDYSDYIKASSYKVENGSVKTAAGKYFIIEGTETVLGSADADYVFGAEGNANLADIAGKKFLPIVHIATGGVKYLAFTDNGGNRKLAGDDVQVYVVTGYDLAKGKAYLKAVEGNVIPKGLPVVIGNKTEDDDLPADIFILGGDDSQTTVEGLLKNFVNCDGSKTLQDYLDAVFGEGVSASEYVPYLLTGGTFKSVDVKATDVIKKDICLLFIPKWDVLKGNSVGTTASSARIISIGGDDGTATGIEAVQATSLRSGLDGDAWHDLQGRRLSEKPARKGLYIRNGKKVVVK